MLRATDRSGGDMPYTPDLTALLNAGATFSDEHATYVIEPQPLDEVLFPSGEVVACDPLVLADDSLPFTTTIRPGRYPLRAWVAVLFQNGAERQRRTAAVELVVRDEPVVGWELALTGEQDLSSLGEDEYFGYGVDAGTGALADLVAVRALAAWDFDRLDEVFIPAQMPPAPAAIGAVTDEATGANVVTVSSGWGDGCYPTFIGYTVKGDIASFVTDFMVVPDNEG
jgi:uncharacterized protein DUF4241